MKVLQPILKRTRLRTKMLVSTMIIVAIFMITNLVRPGGGRGEAPGAVFLNRPPENFPQFSTFG